MTPNINTNPTPPVVPQMERPDSSHIPQEQDLNVVVPFPMHRVERSAGDGVIDSAEPDIAVPSGIAGIAEADLPGDEADLPGLEFKDRVERITTGDRVITDEHLARDAVQNALAKQPVPEQPDLNQMDKNSQAAFDGDRVDSLTPPKQSFLRNRKHGSR